MYKTCFQKLDDTLHEKNKIQYYALRIQLLLIGRKQRSANQAMPQQSISRL